MELTKEQAVASGDYAEVKVPVDLLVNKKTGNVLYHCEKCGKLFDKYIYMCDPTEVEGKPVNILCKDCKRKWARAAKGAQILAFLLNHTFVKLDNAYVEMAGKGQDFLKNVLKWDF